MGEAQGKGGRGKRMICGREGEENDLREGGGRE